MTNAYFQFKEFTVFQDQCAMKVSTDACIQGAYFASKLKYKNITKALDIGTGTGLLTLMLAQVLPNTLFVGIEIDANATRQSKHNFSCSPWAKNLTVTNTSLVEFDNIDKYDAIICNPPFFTNHLPSTLETRALARHNESLPMHVLAQQVAALLKDEGLFCVMYPKSEWHLWLQHAIDNKLHLQEVLYLQPNSNKAANRVIGIFSKIAAELQNHEDMCIYESNSRFYTADAKRLLAPYYLHL